MYEREKKKTNRARVRRIIGRYLSSLGTFSLANVISWKWVKTNFKGVNPLSRSGKRVNHGCCSVVVCYT